MLDISIDYKNHNIDTWYINAVTPDNSLVIKFNGNASEILSSNIKVDFSED
jgi:hypothetical protein